MNTLELTVRNRIEQHKDNLDLWNNGTLALTEPDLEERIKIKRALSVSGLTLEK